MFHVPLLRWGRPYQSLETAVLKDYATGEPVASVSQANPGLIAKDLRELPEHPFLELSTQDLLGICREASRIFRHSSLPAGEMEQSPDDYIRCLSATTGMPEALCRKNVDKICGVLENMEAILSGLSREKEVAALEDRFHYICNTIALGAILPNNSPGVHSLWLPAIALKVPLALKPGREEPWTPYRIAQAFIAAGCPAEAFGCYPADHSGASEILLRCERSMLFGDESTLSAWRNDPRVELHGPGWSKVLLGPDASINWQRYLDVLVRSVSDNGGRSCINASGVRVTQNGRELAEGLAQKLSGIVPRDRRDPLAAIAAFSNPLVAKSIHKHLESLLRIPGAEDLTARFRSGERLVESHGGTYLLPTVIWCDSVEHPLAQMELLFPFVSVVQVEPSNIVETLGHTLVLSAITEDQKLIDKIVASPLIDRLHLGPIPTTQIAWDQPHEGNLFEHLFRRRSLVRI